MTKNSFFYLALIFLFSFSLIAMYFQFFILKNFSFFSETEDGELIRVDINTL